MRASHDHERPVLGHHVLAERERERHAAARLPGLGETECSRQALTVGADEAHERDRHPEHRVDHAGEALIRRVGRARRSEVGHLGIMGPAGGQGATGASSLCATCRSWPQMRTTNSADPKNANQNGAVTP